MLEIFWFWFFIFLLLVTVFAWPTRPYATERWVYRRGGGWCHAPSGIAAALAVLLMMSLWLRLLAITWPWYAVPTEAG